MNPLVSDKGFRRQVVLIILKVNFNMKKKIFLFFRAHHYLFLSLVQLFIYSSELKSDDELYQQQFNM